MVLFMKKKNLEKAIILGLILSTGVYGTAWAEEYTNTTDSKSEDIKGKGGIVLGAFQQSKDPLHEKFENDVEIKGFGIWSSNVEFSLNTTGNDILINTTETKPRSNGTDGIYILGNTGKLENNILADNLEIINSVSSSSNSGIRFKEYSSSSTKKEINLTIDLQNNGDLEVKNYVYGINIGGKINGNLNVNNAQNILIQGRDDLTDVKLGDFESGIYTITSINSNYSADIILNANNDIDIKNFDNGIRNMGADENTILSAGRNINFKGNTLKSNLDLSNGSWNATTYNWGIFQHGSDKSNLETKLSAGNDIKIENFDIGLGTWLGNILELKSNNNIVINNVNTGIYSYGENSNILLFSQNNKITADDYGVFAGYRSNVNLIGNNSIVADKTSLYASQTYWESGSSAGCINLQGQNYLEAKERTVWATELGQIDISGFTEIKTSDEDNAIAVVAGNEDINNKQKSNVNINVSEKNSNGNTIINGAVVAGNSGTVNIGNGYDIKGDLLAGNKGSLSMTLTGSFKGRVDDYQDADVKGTVESGFFNPKFSNEVTESGIVDISMCEGAIWDVTGQSWLTTLGGNGGVIDMRNGGADDTSHAVHISDLEGNHTFVMDLDTEHSVSDMLFIKGQASGEQKLWINSINGLDKLEDGDSLRFATVNSAGLTFSGDYNFGSYENAKNGIMLADNGVMDNAFIIKSEEYDVNDSKNENIGYNGGTEFDEVKPGDEYVDGNYASGINWYLEREKAEDKTSDAGKTIINMSKVNYNNAIYMDRLNKRLGEARYISPEDEQGMWVRIRHDRIGKDEAFRSQNTMYEMGYDVKQDCDNGERRIGMAIDYMDGKAEYTGIAGDGDVKRYGLWLYDTWLGDKGHYTDYVLKWGHLENDFDIMARTTGEKITGDYSNNVFSASAEYGKKNDMGGGWYFEPQAQLQFARVTGADYVTSQDTKVSLDGINSLIGRAGFRLGRDLNENSTVYIKADLLHEFLGDQDITATDITGTLREEYENEGTWYDVGFGFATALGKSSYAFMDFEKSFGNDNDETYQINAGVQWTF